MADFGYAEFFLVAGMMGIPAILLSLYMHKNGRLLDERAPANEREVEKADSEGARE